MAVLATRERVKSALDIAETARADTAIDDAIAAGTQTVEQAICHRTFRPVTATRYFGWPTRHSHTWRVWFDQHDLITATTVVTGDTTLTASQYLLEPVNTGPPYTRIELDLSSTATFETADTHQRSLAITGLWGHSNAERPAGALAEALDASETAVDVTDGSVVGVGDVIRVDDERMAVTERTWLDTGENLGGDLTAALNDQAITVDDGTDYAAGEDLLIDSETMRITAVSGNDLTVRRQWDGSTLAAHTTGADIYASRTLTVERGALGTTAAAHDTAAAVVAHVVPALVGRLVRAYALVELGLERAAYALSAGTGDAAVDTSGGGLAGLESQVRRAYARKARFRSV